MSEGEWSSWGSYGALGEWVSVTLVSVPLPAGLAQCAELCWQLRGEAGPRQVPNTRLALQHNIGLGGAVVVTLYRKGFPSQGRGSRRVGAAYTSGGLKSAPVFDEIERRIKSVCLVHSLPTSPPTYCPTPTCLVSSPLPAAILLARKVV